MSLKNRALIALITIVAAVFGTLSFSSLKQELIPLIEIPSLVVVTPHQGASAEVVATDVTDPIEKALQTVPGLRSTETTSSTGLSLVIAEFDYGSDTAKLEQKMTQSVSRISSILPENVTPEVMSFNFDDFPVIQLAVSNDDTEGLATKLNDLVVPDLERLDGVASASVLGAPGQRISITPDSEAMAEEGIDTEDLASLLANYGILMPAGTINDDGHNMAIEGGERLGSAEDIADIPLPPAQEMPDAAPGGEGEMPEGMPGGECGMPEGELPEGVLPEVAAPGGAATPTEPESAEPVLVGDIADVELVDDPVSSYSLINGERALTLSITKTPDANTVEVSHLGRDAIPHLKELVSEAEFDVLIDQAPFIEESISSLGIEGLLGLVMAVLVILLFLRSGRATLVTAVSIPTSLLIAFVSMQAAGYTLNMLSLGGLTIAIGRIVDDSIVVIENVERHMRYGKSRRDTIVDAVREVGAAITASTITTVAVFLPIALVGGMSGVLFRPFAFTVTVAMLASLLVALTIVPVLAYWFLKWRGVGEAEAEDADELTEEAATQGWIQKGYSRMLDWVIRHRWSTVAIAVVVLIGTVALAPMMKTNFLGDMGQNELGITQSVAPGTSLDEQLDEAEEVNDVLMGVDGVETVAITIGSGDDMMSLASSEDSISYSLTTDEDGDQEKIEADVRSALEGVVDDENLTISPMAGMGMSNDVEISITGAEPKDVESATVALLDPALGRGLLGEFVGVLRLGLTDPAPLEEPVREHRHDRQRDEQGGEHRHGYREGERPEQHARHSAHERDREEHRDRRDRRGGDCRSHFPYGVDDGVPARLAVAHVSLDVFDDDDRVVHDPADRDRQATEGEHVQRVAGGLHAHKRDEQRGRDRHRRHERRAARTQEQQDDEHGHDQAEQPLDSQRGDGLFDERCLVDEDVEFRVRDELLQVRDRIAHEVGDLNRVRIRSLRDRERQRALAIDERVRAHRIVHEFDVGDVAYEHGLSRFRFGRSGDVARCRAFGELAFRHLTFGHAAFG